MAPVTEIRVDAATAAVLSELDGIFTHEKNIKTAPKDFLRGQIQVLIPTVIGARRLAPPRWLMSPLAPTGSLELVKLATTNLIGSPPSFVSPPFQTLSRGSFPDGYVR